MRSAVDMKNWLMLLIFLISGAFGTAAQKINIARQLDESGNARSSFLEWTKYGDKPLSLVVQYKAKALIEEPKMYLFIDKKTELHEFVEFDTYKIEVPDSATNIHKRISFKEMGDYVISFTNADKEIILSDTLKIRGRNKVFFCSDAKKGKAIDIRDHFRATSTGLYYYKIALKGEDNFGTHQFTMNIYQHDGEGFNTLIGKYKRYVHYNRNQAFLHGPFLDPGKYRVEVYKHNGEPYAVGYLNLQPYEAPQNGKKE